MPPMAVQRITARAMAVQRIMARPMTPRPTAVQRMRIEPAISAQAPRSTPPPHRTTEAGT